MAGWSCRIFGNIEFPLLFLGLSNAIWLASWRPHSWLHLVQWVIPPILFRFGGTCISMVWLLFPRPVLRWGCCCWLFGLVVECLNKWVWHPNRRIQHRSMCSIRTSFIYNWPSSAKCKNQSWSTKGGYGPPGPPGPPWSTLVHIFVKIWKSVDQNGSEWIRWTTGTPTPLGGPGAFRTTLDHAPTFSWCSPGGLRKPNCMTR